MTHEDIRGIASFAQATPPPLALALALTLTSAASPPNPHPPNPHPHPNPEQDTVIAIKAPSGTTLEVPDPDEGMEYPQRRYQIYLKSSSGPVEVFLVSHAESDDEQQAAEHAAGSAVLDPHRQRQAPACGAAQQRTSAALPVDQMHL